MVDTSENNYFNFFDLEVCFNINQAKLKKLFLQNTRKFHPDFYTLSSIEVQEEALLNASYNNEAFKTLSNEDKKIIYVLTILGSFSPTEKEILPVEFLMEVMDLNEQIMDFKAEENHDGLTKIKNNVGVLSNELTDKRSALMLSFDEDRESYYLEKIKNLTLQLRYLRRMKQNIAEEEVEM